MTWLDIPFFPLPSFLKPPPASMLKNSTFVTQFLFEGFSSFGSQHWLVFFIFFLTLYLLTLSGKVDHHLCTPMYYFLSMLSISGTFYAIAIIHCMLSSFLYSYQAIDIQDCATQLFFYLTFVINNCFLLTVWVKTAMWPSAIP